MILADLRPDWQPSEYTFEAADFESRLRFPTCKLIHRLERDWRDDQSLPVQVARAQIAALRTAGNPEGRYLEKWRLVRNLYEIGYTADEVREIFRLVDWMMRLSEELDRRFEEELADFEESKNMPYVTSMERVWMERGEERGRAEGEARGRAEMALSALAELGPIPPETQERVRGLSREQLQSLAGVLRSIGSLEELNDWLNRNNGA